MFTRGRSSVLTSLLMAVRVSVAGWSSARLADGASVAVSCCGVGYAGGISVSTADVLATKKCWGRSRIWVDMRKPVWSARLSSCCNKGGSRCAWAAGGALPVWHAVQESAELLSAGGVLSANASRVSAGSGSGNKVIALG